MMMSLRIISTFWSGERWAWPPAYSLYSSMMCNSRVRLRICCVMLCIRSCKSSFTLGVT